MTNEATEKQRENELWKAIFNTAHGKELKQIWERRLTRVKAFPPELPESHCRYVSGRHSVYIDAIKASESK